jgi:hypothetical protein
MKVVINSCFFFFLGGGGGFSLSKEACEYLGLGWDGFGFYYSDGGRDDPKLIQCVETLGSKASGMCANLRVIEIPDDVDWYIEQYDGFEHVAEKHRTWG